MCLYVYTHIYTYIYTYIYMYTHINVYYIQIDTYKCILYMYAHTHEGVFVLQHTFITYKYILPHVKTTNSLSPTLHFSQDPLGVPRGSPWDLGFWIQRNIVLDHKKYIRMSSHSFLIVCCHCLFLFFTRATSEASRGGGRQNASK